MFSQRLNNTEAQKTWQSPRKVPTSRDRALKKLQPRSRAWNHEEHGALGFQQSTTEEEKRPGDADSWKEKLVIAELVEQLIILCASREVKTNKAVF